MRIYPDSNFSLQQACHKFVMTRVQVCHKFVMTRVQVCHKFVMTRVQACNSSSDMEEEQDEAGPSIADAKAVTNALNNFFATGNIYEHIVDLFKIVDKQID
ncbi:hypothetical protein AVEN_83736-1 [Araneus ventricosus]|uniref:Uncharacterized protein n=1 Tax=Araneus ventricosus TaxID=182803 RepID=A0A4Y2EX33_ARAVE|nr:hypothetical protein AVEN_83736-1 [Araneus ventricosus]